MIGSTSSTPQIGLAPSFIYVVCFIQSLLLLPLWMIKNLSHYPYSGLMIFTKLNTLNYGCLNFDRNSKRLECLLMILNRQFPYQKPSFLRELLIFHHFWISSTVRGLNFDICMEIYYLIFWFDPLSSNCLIQLITWWLFYSKVI